MTIKTQVHTIFLLVGPTECGKTTFAKKVLIPQLQMRDDSKNFIANVQYISSDDLRQQLLGYPYDKYDQVMLESSQQAFDLLFQKLSAVTSYPIHAEFVIVDTTGLSEDFREQVMNIAQQHHYHVDVVLFDYKNIREYYHSERSKKIISQHVQRIRKDVLPNLKRKTFTNIHKVRGKDFIDLTTGAIHPEYEVIIENKDEYVDHLLPTDFEYIVIGDIHERIEELKQMVILHDFPIENGRMQWTEKNRQKRFILIGDVIDKGGFTKEMIHFLTENEQFFYLVKGNHENFVYKYLKGEISPHTVDEELVHTHFRSIFTFEKEEELKQAFFRLVEKSKVFYRLIGKHTSSFIVTHAPCKNKYLGKLDRQSIRNQMRFSLDRTQPYENQLSFLKEEAVGNHPFHLFGHVASRNIVRIKNKIGIDTGIVHNHELTSVIIAGKRPFFHHVKSMNGEKTHNELPTLFQSKKKEVNVNELNEQDVKRLNFVLENNINFISGTMSPANKDLDLQELESLKQGLLYFKKHSVKEVVLQPKYMGSRCNIYLSKDVNRCYAVSRNGYTIQHIDLKPVFKSLLQTFTEYMNQHHVQMMILDGELLPWSALGKGMIDEKFRVVEKALESEIDFLKENGFEQHFQELLDRFESSNYMKDQSTFTKEALVNKYGQANHSSYKQLLNYLPSHVPLSEHESGLAIFKEQLSLYAEETELEYKPFSLLKVIYEDGREVIPAEKTSEIFRFVSDDNFLVVNVTDDDAFVKAETFFRTLTSEQKMEGVVIKPEVWKPNVAPYLKVRKRDYLTLVYGYDYWFPHKYSKLLSQKNIGNKLKTSIAEYELGQQMLSYSFDDICTKDEKYKQLVADLLFEMNKEKEFDPRL